MHLNQLVTRVVILEKPVGGGTIILYVRVCLHTGTYCRVLLEGLSSRFLIDLALVCIYTGAIVSFSIDLVLVCKYTDGQERLPTAIATGRLRLPRPRQRASHTNTNTNTQQPHSSHQPNKIGKTKQLAAELRKVGDKIFRPDHFYCCTPLYGMLLYLDGKSRL